MFINHLLHLGLEPFAELGVERNPPGSQAFEQQPLKTGVFLLGLCFPQQTAEIFADIAEALVGELRIDEGLERLRKGSDRRDDRILRVVLDPNRSFYLM